MTGPQYTPEAIIALAFLKSSDNEIDVFVEDSAQPQAWLALVRRCLKPGVRIGSVHPVGPRQLVIDTCRSDQAPRSRRRLFIIDRDLDDLTGSLIPRLRHLYRLDKSCFENLILGNQTFLDIAIACSVKKTEAEIITICDFDQWHADSLRLFRQIFVIFACMMILGSGRKAASIGYSKFLMAPQRSIVDPAKITSASIKLARYMIEDFGYDSVIAIYSLVKIRARVIDPAKYVSGKHFLFPLFAKRFKELFPYKGGNDELMVHLARRFQVSADPGLTRRLQRL